MGQQQLLFILLGLIIIALAIFMGIVYFRANAIEGKRNNVVNECVNLASMAKQYYMRPTTMGGGGRFFTGWRIPSELQSTANGRFYETVAEDSVVIIGVGNEVVTGTDSVMVKTTISSVGIQTTIIN